MPRLIWEGDNAWAYLEDVLTFYQTWKIGFIASLWFFLAKPSMKLGTVVHPCEPMRVGSRSRRGRDQGRS